MNRILRIEGHLDVVSPLHHGGDEKTGSVPVLRSIQWYDPQQEAFVRLPFLSGNAIRGILRRHLFRHLLAQVDYGNPAPKLYHMLFSGGILESTSEKVGQIDLALRRRIRDTIPPLALLGSAVGNQIIDGCLKVDHAIPICKEYASCLPPAYADDPRAQYSVRQFTDIAFATRRDDLRAEREQDEQATQMLVEFECLIPGTRLVHGFSLEYANELEQACLAQAIALWAEDARVGGKSASGYGKLAMSYQPQLDPAPYLRFLQEHGEAIRELMDELATILEGKSRGRKMEAASD